jgi:hypothetical protein
MLAALLACGWSGAAFAGLGETVASVQHDQSSLKASALAVTPARSFDLHEMTTPDGVLVREYVSRAGTVFAVTWSGRNRPDLSVVLGQHYQDYLRATEAPHRDHKVLSIETPQLVLHIRKLPRGFVGGAYLPALLPAGTTAQDIL